MDDLDSQVRSMMSQRGKWGFQQIESSSVPHDAVPSAWTDNGGDDDKVRKPLAPRQLHTIPQQGRDRASTLLQARAVRRTCSSDDEHEGDASP
jgi:hypothetical protein